MIKDIANLNPYPQGSDTDCLLTIPQLATINYSTIHRIRRPNPELLRRVVATAWDSVDWSETSERYWDKVQWQYRHTEPTCIEKESEEVQQMYQIVGRVLSWALDSRSIGHLQPIPGIPRFGYDDKGNQIVIDYDPPQICNPRDHQQAITWFAAYMLNYGQQTKMLPLIAVDKGETPIGFGVYRARGVKHLKRSEKGKIGSVERLIVNSDVRRTGVATSLVASIHHLAINEIGQEGLRAWILTDKVDWGPNYELFDRFGYAPIGDERVNWSDYCASRGMPSGGREALWLEFRVRNWSSVEHRIPIALKGLHSPHEDSMLIHTR